MQTNFKFNLNLKTSVILETKAITIMIAIEIAFMRTEKQIIKRMMVLTIAIIAIIMIVAIVVVN